MVWASHVNVLESFAFMAAPVLFVCAVLLALARTRRWARLWLLLVPLLPPLTVCGVTSYQYLVGTVRTPTWIGFSRERANLDREYRVGSSVPSDKPWASLVARIQHRTLYTLVDWFGPVPGSYQGPYPDRQTAYAEARSALLLVAPAALTRPLQLQRRSIQLSSRDLQLVLSWTPALEVEDTVVAVKLFERTLLLIGFDSGQYYHVELIDTSGFGWFARYAFLVDADPEGTD
jgi:hypothetical protein